MTDFSATHSPAFTVAEDAVQERQPRGITQSGEADSTVGQIARETDEGCDFFSVQGALARARLERSAA